jgi:hypothetical protein
MRQFGTSATFLAFLAEAACSSGADAQLSQGVQARALSVCFFTADAIECTPADGELAAEFRARVEDFYPSICLDTDSDGDGIGDFVDARDDGDDTELDDVGDDHGGDDLDDDSDDNGVDDDSQCHVCDRGPGEQGDFRLEREGDAARLDRGTVSSVSEGFVLVPTPYGPAQIVISASTLLDTSHGALGTGAAIRVEGTWVEGADIVIQATWLEVLCPGPAPVPDEVVPEDAVPATDAGG